MRFVAIVAQILMFAQLANATPPPPPVPGNFRTASTKVTYRMVADVPGNYEIAGEIKECTLSGEIKVFDAAADDSYDYGTSGDLGRGCTLEYQGKKIYAAVSLYLVQAPGSNATKLNYHVRHIVATGGKYPNEEQVDNNIRNIVMIAAGQKIEARTHFLPIVRTLKKSKLNLLGASLDIKIEVEEPTAR